MRRRPILLLLTSALVLAACDGGDTSSAAESDAQADVADFWIAELETKLADAELGDEVDVDAECMRAKAAELSDADAAAILDAGPDGAPSVSRDAQVVGQSLLDCIERDVSAYDVASDTDEG